MGGAVTAQGFKRQQAQQYHAQKKWQHQYARIILPALEQAEARTVGHNRNTGITHRGRNRQAWQALCIQHPNAVRVFKHGGGKLGAIAHFQLGISD